MPEEQQDLLIEEVEELNELQPITLEEQLEITDSQNELLQTIVEQQADMLELQQQQIDVLTDLHESSIEQLEQTELLSTTDTGALVQALQPVSDFIVNHQDKIIVTTGIIEFLVTVLIPLICIVWMLWVIFSQFIYTKL